MGALEQLGQAEAFQRAAGQGALQNFLNASEPEMMDVWELESTEHPQSSAASGLKGCWGTVREKGSSSRNEGLEKSRFGHPAEWLCGDLAGDQHWLLGAFRTGRE